MSKENDPLVEAVARAICFAKWGGAVPSEVAEAEREYGYDLWLEEARAAIKAVLEWYSKAENFSNEMRDAAARKAVDLAELDDFDGPHNEKHIFSAAMAAELKRREG